MHNELTNLLPSERRHLFRRDYFLRLCVVITAFLIALILADAVLLIPTYMFLTESAHTKEARLASIESTLSSSDDATFSSQLVALSDNAATLEALAKIPSVTVVIRKVLDIARPGIIISGLAYSPFSDKKPGTLTISGTAATRDALRSYQLALQSASFARSADLPVSAYAKDTNIAFTITVTLTP